MIARNYHNAQSVTTKLKPRNKPSLSVHTLFIANAFGFGLYARIHAPRAEQACQHTHLRIANTGIIYTLLTQSHTT